MGGLLRLLLLALALWLIVSAIRRVFLFLALPRHEKEGHLRHEEVPLVQDLQCGRFVPEREAIHTSFRGQRLHFCSQQCCDLYIRAHLTEGQKQQ